MWNDIKKLCSSNDNVFKYVFKKPDAAVESVLYKYPTFEDRTVICCSTMSGCPVGCRFCGAGDAFIRNLTAEEIVSQPKYLLESNNIDASKVNKMQIMFMSMGEPMLNYPNLEPALRELNVLYPKARLLISSIGPKSKYWSDLEKISQEIPAIGLQFSVHESTDEARNKLIPLSGKMTLEEIAATGGRWWIKTDRNPFFNYCVHASNNTEADADRLLKLFNPRIWCATLSVVCERDETIAKANERQRKLTSDFMDLMLARGYDTRMFDPAGQDDIGGGCGQLFHFQNWVKENPDKAKKTCGADLPIVHMPTIEGVCQSV